MQSWKKTDNLPPCPFIVIATMARSLFRLYFPCTIRKSAYAASDTTVLGFVPAGRRKRIELRIAVFTVFPRSRSRTLVGVWTVPLKKQSKTGKIDNRSEDLRKKLRSIFDSDLLGQIVRKLPQCQCVARDIKGTFFAGTLYREALLQISSTLFGHVG